MDPDRIIHTIKENHISPIPRSRFVILRTVTWAVGITVTILGGFVFAKVIASLLSASWESWDYVFPTFQSFLFSAMPFVWMLLIIVFAVLSTFIIHKTEVGYKYKRVLLLIVSILISFALAVVILTVGAKVNANKFFTSGLAIKEAVTWSNPDKGRLFGSVESRSSGGIVLRDIYGDLWIVDTSRLLPKSQEFAEEESMVRVIGIQTDDNIFLACQVLPFDYDSQVFEIGVGDEYRKSISENIPDVAKDVCKAVLKE